MYSSHHFANVLYTVHNVVKTSNVHFIMATLHFGRLKIGERVFSVIAPQVWNHLPRELKMCL